jgi:hypothetical protein
MEARFSGANINGNWFVNLSKVKILDNYTLAFPLKDFSWIDCLLLPGCE